MNNTLLKHAKRHSALLMSTVLLASMALPIINPSRVQAAVTNPAAAAKVSFTFDDGLASAATVAQPILAANGLTATDYVITGCVGMTKVNNTCHANTDAIYMTWAQITKLQSQGWEIGSHTVTHPYLATSDATDGQPNVLTPAQVTTELTQSKTTLASHGINAQAFSTPYGDYNNSTLAQIAKYYSSHRGFADQNPNNWAYNDYLLNDMQVQEGVTVAQVEARIDQAIASKQWLVLTMHDIKAKPSTNPDDYEYSTAELTAIAAYVKAKQKAGLISATNVSNGLVTTTNDTNIMPNSSFNSGIGGGWRTDSPSTITADTGNNGSYPDATNSVKLVASASTTHLFSPVVTVDPYTTYMMKNFVNVANNVGGELGFYVDEYDAAGHWISGQYKAGERGNFVEDMNFVYKPSSVLVAKASLQVIVSGGSGITAYLDNCQWFGLSTAVAPVQTNLVTNGTFDAGITGGWTTDDPANITADNTSQGSPNNVINSVKLVANPTKQTHLFSPKVVVNSAKQYQLLSYLNIHAINSGEVAYYIDEYDAAGNWVSGQYKFGVSSLGGQTQSLLYTPTSAGVSSASLQIIVVANSGITAYFDDVRWYAL